MRPSLHCLLILFVGITIGAGSSRAQRLGTRGPRAKVRPAATTRAIKQRAATTRSTLRRGPGPRQRAASLKLTTTSKRSARRTSTHRAEATKRATTVRPTRLVRAPRGKKAAPRGRQLRPSLRAPATKRPSRIANGANAIKHKLDALRNHPKVKSATLRVQKISAAITRKLDSWQARGPPWLAKGMNAVRTYSLMSMAGFSLKKVKADGKFLGSYMVANGIITNVVLPGSIALGMDPVLSGVLNLASTPVTMAVIILRERHLKKKAGEDLSIAQTAKSVLGDYAQYAKKRRVERSATAQRLATSP